MMLTSINLNTNNLVLTQPHFNYKTLTLTSANLNTTNVIIKQNNFSLTDHESANKRTLNLITNNLS